MQTRSNINVKTINLSKKEFFMRWLEFLKPYHGLRHKEIELLGLFLYKRHYLQKVVKDDKILTKILFDTDSRKQIRKELGYNSGQVLNNMISSLRSKKVIDKNNNILKTLIPDLDGDNFKLVFNFNINETRPSTEKSS